jgi:hypothetical protein
VKNLEPVTETVGMAAMVEIKVARLRPILARENNMSGKVEMLVDGS